MRRGFTSSGCLDTLDRFMAGGHAVIRLDGLRVPESAVLGQVGAGFRYAQVRLAPARLTHCMRWLGAARRAHDIATDYARKRTAFGKPIGEHEGVGFMLADNEMDIHQCRLVIWHTAWVLDQGQRGRHESSMAKVICSEAIWRVVDRSMQILGGLGRVIIPAPTPGHYAPNSCSSASRTVSRSSPYSAMSGLVSTMMSSMSRIILRRLYRSSA